MTDKFVDWCIARRRIAWIGILAVTVVMAVLASSVEIKTVFADLLPQNHPFVKINDRFKQAYGGSNMVSIMVEVQDGDILAIPVLERIKAVTEAAANLPGADPFQVTSIASKKLKEITSSSHGIESRPLMWPELPKSDEEIAVLRKAITNNPLVYGAYVSNDFKAALVTVDFYDHLVDYRDIFEGVSKIVSTNSGEGVTVRVVGEPVLYGWVIHYFSETAQLFAGTIAALFVLLFLVARTWTGTIIPILAAATSAVWAVGFCGLMEYHLDPLLVVVAFLITALAISNSVQVVTRCDQLARAEPTLSSTEVAKTGLREIIRPALLAVIADAGCMVVVAMTPIPLLQKIAIIGSFWVMSLVICAVVLPAIAIAGVRRTHKHAHPINVKPPLRALLRLCSTIATSRARYGVIAIFGTIFVVSAIYSLNLKVGDANPGSPILEADAPYNRDARAINQSFQGSDRMFVVFSGDQVDSIKQPSVLAEMEQFQRFMEAQPEIGGSVSLVDVLPEVNRVLHEGNPRYLELGADAGVNGELAYLFVSGSDPGDLQRYVSTDYTNASVTLFFRDHQGDTIRNAVSRIEDFIKERVDSDVEILLAGGLVGVLAAVNDVILAGQVEAIAFALLILALVASAAYRSLTAGTFFMIPVVISNALTFSYMAYYGIGMNINTLPVVALGIGLGVDYSFYVVDAIREEFDHHGNLKRAIEEALQGAGMGVVITVLTLIASVSLWSLSSLRLQSEMAALIAVWLGISAIASLVLMPALVYAFKPSFVVGRSSRNRVETALVPA